MVCVKLNVAQLMHILWCLTLIQGQLWHVKRNKREKKHLSTFTALKKCLNIGSLIYHTAVEQKNRIRQHIIMAQYKRESVKLKTHYFLALPPPPDTIPVHLYVK